jgi:hypothetical protein
MSQVVEGIVRGGKIELIDGPKLADGQRVQVVIDPITDRAEPASGEEGAVLTPLTDPALIELLARIRRNRPALPPSPAGPGRESAAGMLADDAEFDAIMAEIERLRRSDHGREISE